jgi:hypothetical protein
LLPGRVAPDIVGWRAASSSGCRVGFVIMAMVSAAAGAWGDAAAEAAGGGMTDCAVASGDAGGLWGPVDVGVFCAAWLVVGGAEAAPITLS